MEKAKVMIFNRYYTPAYLAGGAITTLRNMVDAFREEFEFYIVTSSTDVSVDGRMPNVAVNQWVEVCGAKVQYIDWHDVSMGRLNSILKEVSPKLIYLNSFFDILFTARILLLRKLHPHLRVIPVLLAPRGEFSKGALKNKFLKKHIYIFLSRLLLVHKGIFWHLSTRTELREFKQGYKGKVKSSKCFIALDVPSAETPTIDSAAKMCDTLRIVFISRIAPKKNLNYAIKLLGELNLDQSSSITFDIYGPIDDVNYWNQCLESVAFTKSSNLTINYGGPLRPESVVETLSRYDLFLFPTLGENYGHVIFEALSAGLVVICSDKCPWDIIEQYNCGEVIKLEDKEGFKRAVSKYLAMPPDKFLDARGRCLQLAREISNSDKTRTDNSYMLTTVISSVR